MDEWLLSVSDICWLLGATAEVEGSEMISSFFSVISLTVVGRVVSSSVLAGKVSIFKSLGDDDAFIIDVCC